MSSDATSVRHTLTAASSWTTPKLQIASSPSDAGVLAFYSLLPPSALCPYIGALRSAVFSGDSRWRGTLGQQGSHELINESKNCGSARRTTYHMGASRPCTLWRAPSQGHLLLPGPDMRSHPPTTVLPLDPQHTPLCSWDHRNQTIQNLRHIAAATASLYCFNPFTIGTHLYHEFWVWLDGFIDISKGLERWGD